MSIFVVYLFGVFFNCWQLIVVDYVVVSLFMCFSVFDIRLLQINYGTVDCVALYPLVFCVVFVFGVSSSFSAKFVVRKLDVLPLSSRAYTAVERC